MLMPFYITGFYLNLSMNHQGKTMNAAPVPTGHTRAILRGGTFHRLQILLPEGHSYIDHCGVSYKVTRQKDAQGRVICTLAKD